MHYIQEPKQVLLYRSENEYQHHLKHILTTWQIEIIEVSFLVEIRDRSLLDDIPVALAIVTEGDADSIDFLRSVMHSNNWIQRMMLCASKNLAIYERAINKAHVNYLLQLPPDEDRLRTYLTKAWRRFQDLTRPFDKFEALTNVTEDLLHENRKFRVEANTDALTKLMNRRSFNSIMKRIWFRTSQKGLFFSMALLDIDHFKKVNDTYGHVAGDHVLKGLADILIHNQRVGIDYAFRYGGEEFAILSTSTKPDEMHHYMERLLEIVNQTDFEFEGHHIHISFSAGVCSSKESKDAEEMITNADKALYQAKENGRNQVLIFSEKMAE